MTMSQCSASSEAALGHGLEEHRRQREIDHEGAQRPDAGPLQQAGTHRGEAGADEEEDGAGDGEDF
jgi:hypothetical protein